MGRSSKFIASEVRLRSPSWKAWAVASIALCLAFAGAGDARAQWSPPMPSMPSPPIHVSPPPLTIPSAVNAIPNLSATFTRKQLYVSKQGLIDLKAGKYSRPEGAGPYGPKQGPIDLKAGINSRPEGAGPYGHFRSVPPSGISNIGGSGISNTGGSGISNTGGGIAGTASKTSGGDTLGGAPVGGGSTRAASLCTRIRWERHELPEGKL